MKGILLTEKEMVFLVLLHFHVCTLCSLNRYVYPSSLLFLFYIIGMVKADEPILLKEFGGHLELAYDWARYLLKSMEWVKRKGTTGEVEPSEKFLQEEKFFEVKFQELY